MTRMKPYWTHFGIRYDEGARVIQGVWVQASVRVNTEAWKRGGFSVSSFIRYLVR